jgi:arginine exporter protein ArgO
MFRQGMVTRQYDYSICRLCGLCDVQLSITSSLMLRFFFYKLAIIIVVLSAVRVYVLTQSCRSLRSHDKKMSKWK